MKISFLQNTPIYKSSIQEKPTKQVLDNFSYNEFSNTANSAIKNNALAAINFKGKTLHTIEEIVSKLKNEYGINAEFENLDIAKLTLESIENFIKYNNKKIFEGLVIKSHKSKEESLWSYNCDYTTKEFSLSFNNAQTYEEIKEKAQNSYDECQTSSNNPKYHFYTGLATFLCFKQNPYAFVERGKSYNYNDAVMNIIRKMATNAASTPVHYNANYIASKMCKVELPPKAENFYEEFAGANINFPPENKTKMPMTKIHDFETVQEASQYLKKYGIDASFENLKCANLTAACIEDFIEINKNPDMFQGLIIGSNIDDNCLTVGSTSTNYDFEKQKIIDSRIDFNLSYDWDRLEKNVYKSYCSGHYASDSPKNPIYHELAHWLDFQTRPEEYTNTCNKYKNGTYVNDFGKKIFGKVSNYATKSSIEFVAEYIAARMCGYKFPNLTNEHYHKNTPLNLVFPE